jgi:hypothetical protein
VDSIVVKSEASKKQKLSKTFVCNKDLVARVISEPYNDPGAPTPLLFWGTHIVMLF